VNTRLSACETNLVKKIVTVVFFLLGDSLASEFYVPAFQNTLSVNRKFTQLHHLWRWSRQSVPKCVHIKFRCWGITQKKAFRLWQKFEIRRLLVVYNLKQSLKKIQNGITHMAQYVGKWRPVAMQQGCKHHTKIASQCVEDTQIICHRNGKYLQFETLGMFKSSVLITLHQGVRSSRTKIHNAFIKTRTAWPVTMWHPRRLCSSVVSLWQPCVP
jgi:hypothetical protein